MEAVGSAALYNRLFSFRPLPAAVLPAMFSLHRLHSAVVLLGMCLFFDEVMLLEAVLNLCAINFEHLFKKRTFAV